MSAFVSLLATSCGDPNAEYQAAYDRGDYKGALKILKPMADQGDATAQFNLGVMYAEGEGVPQDYKEAVKWYRLGANQGRATAQLNLGVIYVKGQGVPLDYIQPYMWFSIAEANGNKTAVRNMDVMEKEMTAEQVSQAQEVAKNWTPNP